MTVHISDSEDDSEEYITDEEREEGEEGDPEMQAGRSGLSVETGPPTSCIIPTYRWTNLRESECPANLFSPQEGLPWGGVRRVAHLSKTRGLSAEIWQLLFAVEIQDSLLQSLLHQIIWVQQENQKQVKT